MRIRRVPHRPFALLALLLLFGTVWAEEERPRIVLMDIRTNEALDDAAPDFNSKLRQALRHHLRHSYAVVPSDEVMEALIAADLTAKEVLYEEKSAGKLAQALSAARILVGHAEGRKGEMSLKARVFDAETGTCGEWGTLDFADLTVLWDRTRPLLEDTGLLPRELEQSPEYFKARTGSERARIIRRQFKQAGEDVKRLTLLHEWMTVRGLEEEAERCVELVEEQAPDSEWVSERRGRVDLRKIYGLVPEDDLLFDHPNRACEELERMQEYAPDWGTRKELRKAERLLGEVKRHLERLKTDDRYLEEFQVVEGVRKSPLFGDLHFQVRSRPHFLVFAEHEEYASPGRVANAVAAADHLLDELQGTYDDFLKAFAKGLDLPDLDAVKEIEDRVFKVFLFQDQGSFLAFHDGIEDPSPLRHLGPYHLASDRWLLTFPAPGDATAGPAMARTRAAAANQVLHLMKKLALGRGNPESVLWSDPRLTSSLLLIELGLPAMIGARSDADRVPAPAFGVNLPLLKKWRAGVDGMDFDAAMLIEIDAFSKLTTEWRMRGGSDGLKGALPIFEAQAWALCDYLWHGEGGKNRKGLLKYLKSELRGESGVKAFLKALYGRKKPRWTHLEERWRTWVKDL